MLNAIFLIGTTFLAASIEVIEVLTILLGVGLTRGWRATLIGLGVGVVVLAVIVGGLGAALTAIPIAYLRILVGGLLLIFGLQWLRKAIVKVSQQGFAGEEEEVSGLDASKPESGFDWNAFVIALKGTVLEGLEVAFIVITFGAQTNQVGLAAIGAGAAIVIVGGTGAALHGWIARIPGAVLRLVVGILLTTFGTFWSGEGVGVSWPGGDLAILGLLVVVTGSAAAAIWTVARVTPGQPDIIPGEA